jgi:membrane protein YqaA with SNARE-associated domain
MKVLAPLGGPWAILIIATLDAAAFGIPMDPLVAFYVHREPSRFFLYTVLAAAGSAIGSLVPYAIGYKGGEALLIKRIGEAKFRRIHGMSEKYGDLALIVPAMLPPPTPFKLFVFSAGVAEMSWPHFMLAIFAGRVMRFFILSALTIRFGPQIVDLTTHLVKQHLPLTLGVISLLALLVWLLIRKRKSGPSSAIVSQ